VLNELAEEMRFDKIPTDCFNLFPTTAIQRLGYMLDTISEYRDKADMLLRKSRQAHLKFRYTSLKPQTVPATVDEYERNETWKIIINEEIEIDE
jgi:predicted transcriptional regulator of viral defense system